MFIVRNLIDGNMPLPKRAYSSESPSGLEKSLLFPEQNFSLSDSSQKKSKRNVLDRPSDGKETIIWVWDIVHTRKHLPQWSRKGKLLYANKCAFIR